ncbi:MAG: lysophospholipid acyltransferase family protein [Thermohalobaculum sp.]|nr:lysophospholipid acyltransferase family protein [Thermohalobaculum sp.]
MADPADSAIGCSAQGGDGVLQALRTRMFELSILIWSAPFGIAILTLFQVYRPAWLVRWALRQWSTGFIAAARWIVGVRYVVEGIEALPRGPVIFVCNHQSYWESIALTALIPDVNVVSKIEATRIPVFGWGLLHAPMIFVHRNRRGSNLRRVLREARASLAEGRSILIFPEGTRVKPGGRRAYQRGLEALCRDPAVAVIPVVHNAGLCWTKGFRTKRAGMVTLRFCPPFPAGRSAAAMLGELERFINVEKDRLLGATVPASAR